MKRIITLLLAVLIACGAVATVSATTMHGDVNLDGDVDIIDATEIQYFIASLVELSSSLLENADVDADGEISVMDATCIKMYLADLIDKFPSQEQDLSLYRPYIQAVLDEHYTSLYGDYHAVGGLYDVDSNGIYELIMLYTIPDPNNQFVHRDVYSIYTMDGDKVIPLVEKELFFMHAGGPSGKVYLMNNGEESFLGFRYTEANPGYEQEWRILGDWDFYHIDGTVLSEHRNVNYFYIENENKEIVYSESCITENGEESPYSEFEEWYNGYDSQRILLSSFNSDGTNSLEDLYNELA